MKMETERTYAEGMSEEDCIKEDMESFGLTCSG